MSWRPLGITFLGVEFGFRKVSKKLQPVAVSQSGAEINKTLYCRQDSFSGTWTCYETVYDSSIPINGTNYQELPPGALQI